MKKSAFVLTILALVAAAFYTGRRLGRKNYVSVVELHQATGGKVTQVMELIRNEYIDSVSLDSITEVILPQIMEVLDPHSTYIPAKDFGAVNESLEGGFAGVGIKFTMVTDTLVVNNVVKDGPSDKAGVREGDRVMRIDTTDIAGVGFDQLKVVEMLRGKAGTTVKLNIDRYGEQLNIDVERGFVSIPSVTASFIVAPETGYVKLEQFARNTRDEVRDAITILQREGAKRLVLDLRGNPGGFLDQAIALANEFLPADKMIVYTETRSGKKTAMHSTGDGRFTELPLTIVVDQNSASSSEILAGAMQDNDRAIIVGRRTFGKGLVQEQIPFADGSAVRLTVARYFTPTGRSIQKPYVRGDAADYALEMYERHGEYFSADSVHLADSLKFTTAGGRTVYGGGGIMPDVFVPLDTTFMNHYYIGAQMAGLPYRFALRWADGHRAQVNAVGSVKDLNTMLDGETNLWDEFTRFATSQGLRGSVEERDVARNVLISLVRADIGRLTRLDDAGFYSQYYAEDQALRVAVEKINDFLH